MVAKAFGDTAHVVGVDSSLQDDAPRSYLRVQRQRAETLGISVASIAQITRAMELIGDNQRPVVNEPLTEVLRGLHFPAQLDPAKLLDSVRVSILPPVMKSSVNGFAAAKS